MPSFNELAQSLPQELQDQIIDLVTATPPIVTIGAQYKPPIGLQISKEVRKRTARHFYGKGKIFHLAFESPDNWIEKLAKWLGSLPAEHGILIEQVKYYWGHAIGIYHEVAVGARRARRFRIQVNQRARTMQRDIRQATRHMSWNFNSFDILRREVYHYGGEGPEYFEYLSLRELASPLLLSRQLDESGIVDLWNQSLAYM